MRSTITLAKASEVLGVVAKPEFFKLSESIISRDASRALELIDSFFSAGIDPALFLKEFASHFRELLLARFGGEKAIDKIGLAEADAVEALRQVGNVSREDLLDLVRLRSGADEALRSMYVKYALEALVVRLATREPILEIAQALKGFKGPQQNSTAQKKTEKSVKATDKNPNKEHQVSDEKISTSSAANSLSWLDFVNHVKAGGHGMLLEYLRRMTVSEFVSGKLTVQSPDFTTKYFDNSANKSKLNKLLSDFSGHSSWNISITTSSDKTASGSIF